MYHGQSHGRPNAVQGVSTLASASIEKARVTAKSAEMINERMARSFPKEGALGHGGCREGSRAIALPPSPGRGAHGLIATGLVCLRCPMLRCTWQGEPKQRRHRTDPFLRGEPSGTGVAARAPHASLYRPNLSLRGISLPTPTDRLGFLKLSGYGLPAPATAEPVAATVPATNVTSTAKVCTIFVMASLLSLRRNIDWHSQESPERHLKMSP